MGRFANAALIAGSLPPGADRKLLLQLATIAKDLKPAQAASKLAGHLKMCRAGDDGNSGYPGRIRPVVNLSRP